MANWAIEYLLSTQNSDGGWGAHPGGQSRTETTALAALALGFTPETAGASDATAGLDWLGARQQSSGAWPAGDGLPGDSWMTSLATLAVSHFDQTGEAAVQGGRWLLRQEGQGTSWWIKLILRFSREPRQVDLDPNLTGWPWTAATFSWVEPTAYALLALKRLRAGLPGALAEDRIELGERMILDRVCLDGGWNYGNSRVLGEDLWSYPDTTALALLALQGLPDVAAIETGLEAIARMVDENRSLLALSLATICMDAYDRPSAALREAIASEADPATAMQETRSIAFAALALVDGVSPFRLVDDA